MTLALHHSPTKTEVEALERRRKFRARIEELASRIAVAPIVEVIKPKIAPVSSLRDWIFVASGGDATVPNATKSIQLAVCREFKINRNGLLSIRRTADLILPRHISMWLCKHFTHRSLPEIGRLHGGRDHTTVLYAVRKIDDLLAQNDQLAARIQNLRAQLEAYFNE